MVFSSIVEELVSEGRVVMLFDRDAERDAERGARGTSWVRGRESGLREASGDVEPDVLLDEYEKEGRVLDGLELVGE